MEKLQMEIFDVSKVATVNEDRIAQDKATAATLAARKAEQAVGAAILAGKKLEEAQAAGKAAAAEATNDWRVWYELDPDVVYPAVIEWLEKNAAELIRLGGVPDYTLVEESIAGSEAALFVLKCKAYVAEHLAPSLALAESAKLDLWELALEPRSTFEDGDSRLIIREKGLEAARLFVTEALHQQTKRAIGLHWSKADDWKLN